MHYSDKFHGIRHGSRIGRIIWTLIESNIHANFLIINRSLTTPNTGSNIQYSGKHHHKWNGKTKNIQRNWHDILLGQRYNTTKSLPHILWIGKEKPVRLCHKTPPNIAPKNYESKIFKTNKKDIEISKYRQTGNRRGCAGTTNTRVTQKLDNHFKGIRNHHLQPPDAAAFFHGGCSYKLSNIYLVKIKYMTSWLYI